MAKRFTRNVKDVKDVKTFGINHTTQNDLINDDKNVFVHQKGKFEKITHQIDTLSSNGSVTIGEKDDKDNVKISVYTDYLKDITSDDESVSVKYDNKTKKTDLSVSTDYLKDINSPLHSLTVSQPYESEKGLVVDIDINEEILKKIGNTYYFASLIYQYEDDNKHIFGYIYFRYDKSSDYTLGNFEQVKKFFDDNMDEYIECTGFLKITNKKNNTVSTNQVTMIKNNNSTSFSLDCFDIMTNTFPKYIIDKNTKICVLSISPRDNRTPKIV